jgi:tol-pal system protein YbgF
MLASRRNTLFVMLLAVSANASAVSKAELEARLEQLERKLDSRSLVNLLDQVTALQGEVQQLRGDIEVQTHTLESLQKRQRDLYLDIDRRLHRLEAGGVQGQAAAPGDKMTGGAPAAAAGATAPAVGAAGSAAGVTGMSPEKPPATKPVAPALNPAEQRKAYDQALELLKEGRYTDAATAFQSFLKQYPDSSYADNAQYWLGEVYYVTRKFEPALTEFDKVIKNHPASPKVADAKLKMGYIQYELKDWAKASELLNQVTKGYPGSTSARLAQERLERMQREGH